MGFKPGISGNPGGRPKGVVAYLKAKYGEDGGKLLARMDRFAFGKIKHTTRREQLAALIYLHERGWGKAPQVVTGDPDAPVQHRVVFGGRHRPDGSVTGA